MSEDKDELIKTLDETLYDQDGNALPSMATMSYVTMEFFKEHFERTVKFNSISTKSIKNGREKNSHNLFHLVMEPTNDHELFKGNLRLDFFGIPKKKLRSDKKRKQLLGLWLCCNLQPLAGTDKPLILTKFEIDKMQKDIKNQKFPKDFQVELNLCHSNNIVGIEINRHAVESRKKAQSLAGGLVSTYWQAGSQDRFKSGVWDEDSDLL
jgi:hypothetical protein